MRGDYPRPFSNSGSLPGICPEICEVADFMKDEVWALLAVSDPGQVETLPHQEKWAVSTAADHGWSLRTENIFGRGKASSGRDGLRKTTDGILTRLRTMSKAERPKRLLLIRIDRLGRGDSLDVMAALQEFRSLGVVLHTREDGDVAISRAIDTFAPMLRSTLAALENEVRKDKAKAHFDRKRAMKKTDPLTFVGQRPPYGLTHGPDWHRDFHLAPDGDAAEAVRMAYRMRVTGHSCGAVAKELLRVAPPMIRKSGKIENYKWDANYVARMLAKEEYRDVLVDADTWYAAQRPDEVRIFPRRKHEWPLTSAIRCECGTAMMGLLGFQAKIFYYACRDRNKVHGKYRCFQKQHLEDQFLALLADLRANPALIAEYTTASTNDGERKLLMKRGTELQKEIGGLDARREKLWTALENGTISEFDFKTRIARSREQEITLRDDAQEVQTQLATMAARQSVAANAESLVRTAGRVWERASTEDRKLLARSVRDALGGLWVSADGTLYAGPLRTEPTVKTRLPKRR